MSRSEKRVTRNKDRILHPVILVRTLSVIKAGMQKSLVNKMLKHEKNEL